MRVWGSPGMRRRQFGMSDTRHVRHPRPASFRRQSAHRDRLPQGQRQSAKTDPRGGPERFALLCCYRRPRERGDHVVLAEAMRDLADRATTAEGQPALDDLVNLAVERVHSARWPASRSCGGEVPHGGDHGPGRHAGRRPAVRTGLRTVRGRRAGDSVYMSGDIACDERWLERGVRVHRDLGVRSVLSQRLRLSEDAGVIAGLNIYSPEPNPLTSTPVPQGWSWPRTRAC